MTEQTHDKTLKASISQITLFDGTQLYRRMFRENGRVKYGWYSDKDCSFWKIDLKTNMGIRL